jgi:tripartite-type tricarboxylate transporter receptor subunit TctC
MTAMLQPGHAPVYSDRGKQYLKLDWPRLVVAILAAAALSSSFAARAVAQNYPTRPVEMIVTWGPGGGADQTGRIVGKLLEPLLKVSIPVDNVPGASGVTGLTKLLGGEPDGYQVGILTGDTFGLLAEPKPQRWNLSDLQPIAVLTLQNSGIFTQVSGPLKTWADVEAKARTTELKVAVTGFGTPDDVAVEQLKKRGLKLLSVPFAKPSERYVAVIGGHADLLYEQAGDIRSFIESKQLAPVLFLANTPVKQFPDVPTTKQLGFGLVLDQFRTIMVKAGTPPEQVALLTEKVREAAANPEYVKFLEDLWADPNSVVVGEAARTYVIEQIEALKKLK